MQFRLHAFALAMVALVAGPARAQLTGPSSSESSYLLPSSPDVALKSIITTGDSIGGYRMAGIPDGLGAFDNGNGTFTVLMNHEIASGSGIVRASGSNGAFVSQWVINKSDLSVVSGQDMIQSSANVFTGGVNGVWTAGTTSFSRLCSADLAPISAFYNASTGLGYNGRIFMNGEETGAEGRAFGWVVGTGGAASSVYQLPALGRFSWENSVANPYAQDKTLVAGTDDSTVNGQVYVYFGTKQNTGNAVERAGLNNGSLFAIKVAGVQQEVTSSNNPFGNGSGPQSFSLVDMSAQAAGTGAALDAATVAAGGTNFARPEDAAWDPTNNRRLYFTTTDTFTGRSRIWRATFADLSNPAAGGSIEVVADGVEKSFKMADNLTVDGRGHVIFQEDVGNNAYLGRVLDLDPTTGEVKVLAVHDAARFLAGGANFKTQDEEASGVIDVTDLFDGVSGYDTVHNRYYLLDTQNHQALGGELVEGGQLQLMVVAVPEASNVAMMLAGLGVLGFLGRRRQARG